MRAASLVLASTASFIGLVFPFALGRVPTGFNQSVLLILMAGIAGAFIYGAGFKPRQSMFRWLIGPAVTWPLMFASFGILVAMR
jgi:predicted membrane protein